MASGVFYRKSLPGDPLTARQQEVLSYVESYQLDHGYPPTLRELCRGIGIKNINGARSHLLALVAKGRLQKVGPEHAGRYRRVVAPGCCPSCGQKVDASHGKGCVK